MIYIIIHPLEIFCIFYCYNLDLIRFFCQVLNQRGWILMQPTKVCFCLTAKNNFHLQVLHTVLYKSNGKIPVSSISLPCFNTTKCSSISFMHMFINICMKETMCPKCVWIFFFFCDRKQNSGNYYLNTSIHKSWTGLVFFYFYSHLNQMSFQIDKFLDWRISQFITDM